MEEEALTPPDGLRRTMPWFRKRPRGEQIVHFAEIRGDADGRRSNTPMEAILSHWPERSR
jgi:hypothetical protein